MFVHDAVTTYNRRRECIQYPATFTSGDYGNMGIPRCIFVPHHINWGVDFVNKLYEVYPDFVAWHSDDNNDFTDLRNMETTPPSWISNVDQTLVLHTDRDHPDYAGINDIHSFYNSKYFSHYRNVLFGGETIIGRVAADKIYEIQNTTTSTLNDTSIKYAADINIDDNGNMAVISANTGLLGGNGSNGDDAIYLDNIVRTSHRFVRGTNIILCTDGLLRKYNGSGIDIDITGINGRCISAHTNTHSIVVVQKDYSVVFGGDGDGSLAAQVIDWTNVVWAGITNNGVVCGFKPDGSIYIGNGSVINNAAGGNNVLEMIIVGNYIYMIAQNTRTLHRIDTTISNTSSLIDNNAVDTIKTDGNIVTYVTKTGTLKYIDENNTLNTIVDRSVHNFHIGDGKIYY